MDNTYLGVFTGGLLIVIVRVYDVPTIPTVIIMITAFTLIMTTLKK